MKLKSFINKQLKKIDINEIIKDRIGISYIYYTNSLEINLTNEIVYQFHLIYYNSCFYAVKDNQYAFTPTMQYWLKINRYYFIINDINKYRRRFLILLLNNKVDYLINKYFITRYFEFHPIDNDAAFYTGVIGDIVNSILLNNKQKIWLIKHWLIYFRIFNKLIDKHKHKELSII